MVGLSGAHDGAWDTDDLVEEVVGARGRDAETVPHGGTLTLEPATLALAQVGDRLILLTRFSVHGLR